jgi:hypothetical protein
LQYTLPVEPDGLESEVSVLQNAIANGARVSSVNIMVFDYYLPDEGTRCRFTYAKASPPTMNATDVTVAAAAARRAVPPLIVIPPAPTLPPRQPVAEDLPEDHVQPAGQIVAVTSGQRSGAPAPGGTEASDDAAPAAADQRVVLLNCGNYRTISP